MQTLAFNIEKQSDVNLLSNLATRIGVKQLHSSDTEILSFLKDKTIRLEIAIWLFKTERISLGKAANFVGMHKILFQKELAKRKIPVHYDIADFKEDIKTLSEL
ncbi:MAG: UPF0175 family protein [Bacteroidales bacterium]|nr:UPF0175 family protein [Bacteroidales bacterium]MCF8457120.1 UPF0175 family protein [Bacteroidales bacterium]